MNRNVSLNIHKHITHKNPESWILTSYKKTINVVTYLFDGNGPSTAYTVSFTLIALCLIAGFPRLQRNKKVSQSDDGSMKTRGVGDVEGVCELCLNSSVCAVRCVLVCCVENVKVAITNKNEQTSR